jgi:hypothetical protein
MTAASLSLALVPGVSQAASCAALEAQLAKASSGSGGGRAKYDRAIAAQEAELGKSRARASRNNCSGIATLLGSSATCRSINSTIKKMEGNLRSLNAKAAKLGGGGNRSQIAATMKRQGCGQTQEKSRSLIEAVFGGGLSKQRGTLSAPPSRDRDTKDRQRVTVSAGRITLEDTGPSGTGPYRTLCVRTCDGYYFPISFSSNSSEFPRDEQACSAMCPGTETELYYHLNADEESEQMISTRDDRPYADLANAFRYRTSAVGADATCACNRPRNFTVLAGKTGADLTPQLDELVVEEFIATPARRPDPALDPESIADAFGAMNEATERRMLAGTRDGTTPVADDVRLVGPVFLPDPKEAIDLRSPAPTVIQ